MMSVNAMIVNESSTGRRYGSKLSSRKSSVAPKKEWKKPSVSQVENIWKA